jgi:hypothetical protein
MRTWRGRRFATTVNECESNLVTDCVITPDFVDVNLVVFTKAPCDVDHPGRHVQMEGRTKPAEVCPLGERFKVIDRLAGLHFDNRLKTFATLLRQEQEIWIEGRGTAPDGRVLLSSRVDRRFKAAPALGLKKADYTVVFKLFADRPHQDGAH